MKNMISALILGLMFFSVSAQVPNDDCANAIDYGVLDGRKQDFSANNGAMYDTCFQVSNIGAMPNFPFFYTNSFCGQASTDTVNGSTNDVWYKISTLGNFEILCNAFSNFPDSVRITFWADGGNGICGSFIGGSAQLITFNNQWYSAQYSFIPFSAIPYLYLQISGIKTNDSVNFYMCLRGGNFSVTPVCSVGEASAYDSLCFIANIASINPSSFNTSDGSISVNVSHGQAPYNFIWSRGDTTTSLLGLSVGTYSLSIIDASGCQNSYSIHLTAPTSVTESSPFNGGWWSIYPNPTSSNLTIQLTAQPPILNSQLTYAIQNPLGQTILTAPITNHKITIDIAALPKGIYIFTLLESNKILHYEKLVKQ